MPSERRPTRASRSAHERDAQGRYPGLLWASPLPPTRSGVADYAAEMLPELERLTAVAILAPPDWQPAPRGAPGGGRRLLPCESATPSGFVPVLHLGNNPYHLWVARRLRAQGGVVVLHDTVLHHLLVEEAATEGEWRRFEIELTAAHGRAGAALAAARAWGFAGRLDPFLFPARRVYLAPAAGVIVHSRRAAVAVALECPNVPVRMVPLAVGALPSTGAAEMRTALGATRDDLLVTHLGFLTPAKGLDQVLRGVAAAAAGGAAVRLAVVGEGSDSSDLLDVVRRAGLGDRVSCWGYATPEALGAILAATDVGVAPRFPTAGETSAAVLRFLAAGTPVVVSGYGQFLEFDSQAAPRMAPGHAGAADLARILLTFAADRSALGARRDAARRAWIAGGHEPRVAAKALLDAVAEITSCGRSTSG